MEELRTLQRLLLASLFLTPAACLNAQQAADSKPSATAPTIAVDARLVNLPVVVHDKKGALVQNLTKDDFTLQVDGHPQTIRYFDIDKDLPLTLGLLVDTSLSQRNAIDDERTASSAFLDEMLTTPKDQAFVIQFARQTELLQDLTSSRPKLQAALKELDTPGTGGSSAASDPDDNDSNNNGSNNGNGNRRSYRRGGTVLYDANFLASDELMGKQKGRKALIILTDGVDNGSKESLKRSIEAAQRADSIIYAIYFKGEEPSNNNNNSSRGRFPGGGYPGGGYPGRYPGGGYPGGGYPGGGGNGPGGGGMSHVDGKKILKQMAEETGGRLFEVSKKETFSDIYKQIAEELRAQYRLGYTPDAATSADGYHQVDLTTHKKDLYVQTRDGYYTGK